ncbi:hypothetical protein DMC47_27050 [Nostoc sp. 3335mG]|nr:hypothetical protein DMC47_27050 [Nostoc sp. 3335mG]
MESENVATRDLEDFIRKNVEAMAFPSSEIEQATYAEVSKLPRVVVFRPPAEELLAAGFVHYDCHRNCGDQTANDPMGLSRHVSGWMPYGDDLILHSVVAIGDRWICLTPQLVVVPSKFQFIPDPLLEWRDSQGGAIRTAFRRGIEMPEVLRKDPDRHISMRDAFNALLTEGHSVIEARDIVAASAQS